MTIRTATYTRSDSHRHSSHIWTWEDERAFIKTLRPKAQERYLNAVLEHRVTTFDGKPVTDGWLGAFEALFAMPRETLKPGLQ
jgi:hypothetical protein